MRPGMDKEFVTLCASYACVQISVDDRGGLNGSTQHRPEVQSADVSRLNCFESVDSKKTLPCLGLIEYSPKDHVSLKTQSDQQIRRVLHRPVEPAGIITTFLKTRPASTRTPLDGAASHYLWRHPGCAQVAVSVGLFLALQG